MRNAFRSSAPLGGLASGGSVRTFVSQLYYASSGLTSIDSTLAMTQDAEYTCRFDVGAATTFDRIGVEVTTGVATAVIRLGIRQDTGQTYPGALVLDAGTVDAATTGFKTATIAQALAPGRYWLTATLQVTTGVSVRGRQLDPLVGQTGTGTINAGSYFQTGVTGALGASFTSTVGVTNYSPKVMMRAA